MRIRLRVLVLFALIVTNGFAQRRQFDPTDIRQAAEDSTGEVWGIAWENETGIYHWNGNNWKLISGLPAVWPGALAQGPDGAIYVLSSIVQNTYVVTWHKGTISKVLARFTEPDLGWRMVVDRKRNVWFAGVRKIFRLTPNGRLECAYTIPNAPSTEGPGHITYSSKPIYPTEDGRGHLWFWSDSKLGAVDLLNGLVIFDGKNFDYHPHIAGLSGTFFTLVAPRDAKHMWVATLEGGLYIVNVDTLTAESVSVPSSPAFNGVQSIYNAGRDTYIVSSGQIPGEPWNPVSQAGMRGTLWRLRDGKWDLVVNGISRGSASGSFISTSSGLWLGTKGDGPLFIPRGGGKPALVDWRFGNPVAGSDSLFQLKDGRLLITSQFSGSIAVIPSELIASFRPSPRVLSVGAVRSAIRDQEGHILALPESDPSALDDWDGKTWTRHIVSGDLRLGQRSTWDKLAQDTQGRVWLLTYSCSAPVAVFDPHDNGFELFPSFADALQAQMPPGIRVELPALIGTCSAPSVASDGRMAFLDDSGVQYFDGKKWSNWDSKQVSKITGNSYISPPFFNREGNLAVNANDATTWEYSKTGGWQKTGFERQPIVSVPAQIPFYKPVPAACGFDKPDSTVRDEFGTTWMTYHGQLYRAFGEQCVPQFGPDEHQPFIDSRELMQVQIDGPGNAFLDARPTKFTTEGQYVIVRPRQPPPETSLGATADSSGNVTLQFGSNATGKVQFEWRVDNSAWSSPATNREVTLEWFPSGKHRFEAVAIDAKAEVDPVPARAEVEVHADPQKQVAKLISELTDSNPETRKQAVDSLKCQPTYGIPLLRRADEEAEPGQREWVDATLEQLTLPLSRGEVNLTVRFGDNQAKYHLGEIIPVTLTFSSVEHRRYPISPPGCGQPPMFTWHIEPPLFIGRDIEQKAEGTIMACFSSGPQVVGLPGSNMTPGLDGVDLSEKPYEAHQILNEEFIVDNPGKYRVFVTSKAPGFAVTSSSVELEILPRDPAWEKAELARAITLMGESPSKPEYIDGCKILRYLDTQDAEVEMAKRFFDRNDCGQMFRTALVSARHRDAVLKQLEAEIEDPGTSISDLRTVALVSVYAHHPDWYPQPATEAGKAENLDAERRRHAEIWGKEGALNSEQRRLETALIAALPRKTPEARAHSLETLLTINDIPEIGKVAQEQLPAILAGLPFQLQEWLLGNSYWEEIKCPAMIPSLKAIVNAGRGPGIALRRLSELSPDDARPYVLMEIANHHWGWNGVEVLGGLPDNELPQFDGEFLDLVSKDLPLRNGSSVPTTALLQRYASGGIAQPLRRVLMQNIATMDCQSEANLLAYFLRVTPQDGAELLRDAVATGGRPGCQLLQRLSEVRMSPEVEDAALAALDNSNPAVVSDGLYVLERYSSVKSQEAILQRFRAWHAKWASRAAELERPENSHQRSIEMGYFQALGKTPTCWATSTEARSLGDQCVSNYCKQAAESLANSWAGSMMLIRMAPASSTEPSNNFSVGQCYHVGGIDKLEQKLELYPKGSVFTFDAQNLPENTARRVMLELKAWTAAHGYDVQQAPW